MSLRKFQNPSRDPLVSDRTGSGPGTLHHELGLDQEVFTLNPDQKVFSFDLQPLMAALKGKDYGDVHQVAFGATNHK